MRRRRLAVHPGIFGHGVGRERLSAGENFVEDQSKRINVAADGGFALGELFRGHVSGRAGGDVVGAVHAAGDSKIGDANLAAAIEHDVGGLQIAMKDAFVMGGGEAGTKLAGDLDRLVLGQATDSAEESGKVFAVDEFHGDELFFIDFADVENPANIGMRYLSGKANLVVESFQPGGVVLERWGQKFESDGLIEGQIIRAIDFSHSADTEQADDSVSLGQNGAGIESAAGGGIEGIAVR